MSQAERQSFDCSIILKLRVMRKITAHLIKATNAVLPTLRLGLGFRTNER
jgi:hypothetical protein